MKIEMSNISVFVNSKREQREIVLHEIEKNGIKREFIKRLDYIKRSIDSRNKNSIRSTSAGPKKAIPKIDSFFFIILSYNVPVSR